MTLQPSPECQPVTQRPVHCRIRPASVPDIEAMAGLLVELFSIEEDFTPDHDRQRQGLSLLLQRSETLVLVAEVEGQVAGMCSCQLLVSTAEGAPAGLVEDVVVSREHRGRGIGAQLMDAVSAWAQEQGATRLQLLADLQNTPALDFYAGRGWQRTQLLCLRLAPLPGNTART